MRRALFLFIVLALTLAPGLARTEETRVQNAFQRTAEADNPAVKKPGTPPAVPGKGLTLAQALNLALQHNPALAAFSEEIKARTAGAEQAGLLPNPALGVDVENFGGSDEKQSFESAETTVFLSQLIALGGKIAKRQQLASLEKELAVWDYRSKEFDALAATATAFVQLLIAQQRETLDSELVKISQQTFATVSARAEAGKVRPIEKTKSWVELASAKANLQRSRRKVAAARVRLAANWGADEWGFGEALGNLEEMESLPEREEIALTLNRNPDIARWGDELKTREAAVTEAESQAIPDLTVHFGVRNFQDTGDNALVAGLELPLPLFDRQQGSISRAVAEQEKTRQQKRDSAVKTRADLEQSWQRLDAAWQDAVALREEILPGAYEAFHSTETGYKEGKFDFLELMDAQRKLFEVKGQYLDATGAYHLEFIQLQRLRGVPIGPGNFGFSEQKGGKQGD
ncbi:MAG: TolC family protein [Deltaproteobacteria bacterium]|nr:TolC family protein [Deltaproteobacteria bacterium]MCB2186306.1 TolC family protein [Deltaproteobacteria bacterium]